LLSIGRKKLPIISSYTSSKFIPSLVESFAQAENESRSQNIRWGIKERAAKGTSKLYDRKCYGYDHDEKGKLVINSDESKVVGKIFVTLSRKNRHQIK